MKALDSWPKISSTTLHCLSSRNCITYFSYRAFKFGHCPNETFLEWLWKKRTGKGLPPWLWTFLDERLEESWLWWDFFLYCFTLRLLSKKPFKSEMPTHFVWPRYWRSGFQPSLSPTSINKISILSHRSSLVKNRSLDAWITRPSLACSVKVKPSKPLHKKGAKLYQWTSLH